MPFKVSYDAESDCIIASIEGEIDFELLEELAAEVVRLSTAHNCRRILNDLVYGRMLRNRSPGNYTPYKTYLMHLL
jgi:hypothetical protein